MKKIFFVICLICIFSGCTSEPIIIKEKTEIKLDTIYIPVPEKIDSIETVTINDTVKADNKNIEFVYIPSKSKIHYKIKLDTLVIYRPDTVRIETQIIKPDKMDFKKIISVFLIFIVSLSIIYFITRKFFR